MFHPLIEQLRDPILVAYLNYVVVKPPLEPHLKSVRILLPNSGDPALVVNVAPTDNVQNNQTTRKFTTNVEFCADFCKWTSRVFRSQRSSVTPPSVLTEPRTRHSICYKNRVLQLENESCDKWEPCPKWDPVEGTCILYDSVDEENSLNINSNPCMFRVAVHNSAYNLTKLIHIPRHAQLFEPNSV